MISKMELQDILYRAIKRGHFKLASGRHSDKKFEIERINPYLESLSLLLARRFRLFRIEAVIGPAEGGNNLSLLVAIMLASFFGQDVIHLETKKVTKKGSSKTDFSICNPQFLAGKRLLIIDDVITTGRSVRTVMDRAREAEAKIIGVGALLNRGGIRILGATKFCSLYILPIEDWEADNCPLCKRGLVLS